VSSVDDRPIPAPGPMTLAIGEEYGRAVRGQVDQYKDWVEHVG
jgi:branched-chain amino acid aminotransferase